MSSSCNIDLDCESGEYCDTSTKTCHSHTGRTMLTVVIFVLLMLILCMFLSTKSKGTTNGADYFLLAELCQCLAEVA